VTDRLVTPYALWGSAIEESGCASAEQAALTTKLESAAGLFNVGLLQTRRGVGWQLYAQQGVNCAQALADWDRFADKQRNLFVSRWQDEAMINVFTSAWLSTTAGTGAACQGSGAR